MVQQNAINKGSTSASLAASTLTATSCITPLITTASPSLQLQQTGDTYGTVNIYAQNRDGVNGLLVANAGLDLSDLVLRGASNSGGTGGGFQANLRYEGRGAFLLDFAHSASSAGEIQFVPSGVSNFEPVYFASGRYSTTIQNQLRVKGTTSGYNGFSVPAVAGSTLWQLPTADGVSGQSLTTNGAANLVWAYPPSAKRQTVLSGSVDSNGQPNALSIGSGLTVTLTASSGTPFLIGFAAGYGRSGAIEQIERYTSNQSFSSLTANTTCYLYVDRNTSTGALTTGFSTLQPRYASIAPTSPSTDQHWFDTVTYVMSRWSGSAWVAFQRVFVGEAVTGASTVTSVATYAYNGSYQSVWTAVAANTTYNFTHNLGIALSASKSITTVYSSTVAGTNESDIATAIPFFSAAAIAYGYYFHPSTIGSSRRFLAVTTGANTHYNGTAWQTSGFYMVAVERGF